jgi:hypothetical protein
VNSIAVEPVSLTPQVAPGTSCGGYPPFATRFNVIVPPYGHGRYVNGIAFNYVDSRGRRVAPFIGPVPIPTPGSSTGIPTTGPIPIPGQPSIFVDPFARAVFPYSLRFPCGFAPKGMLSIRLDMTDQLGASSQTQIAVDVGQ